MLVVALRKHINFLYRPWGEKKDGSFKPWISRCPSFVVRHASARHAILIPARRAREIP
jgi:hypothetical protein